MINKLKDLFCIHRDTRKRELNNAVDDCCSIEPANKRIKTDFISSSNNLINSNTTSVSPSSIFQSFTSMLKSYHWPWDRPSSIFNDLASSDNDEEMDERNYPSSSDSIRRSSSVSLLSALPSLPLNDDEIFAEPARRALRAARALKNGAESSCSSHNNLLDPKFRFTSSPMSFISEQYSLSLKSKLRKSGCFSSRPSKLPRKNFIHRIPESNDVPRPRLSLYLKQPYNLAKKYRKTLYECIKLDEKELYRNLLQSQSSSAFGLSENKVTTSRSPSVELVDISNSKHSTVSFDEKMKNYLSGVHCRGPLHSTPFSLLDRKPSLLTSRINNTNASKYMSSSSHKNVIELDNESTSSKDSGNSVIIIKEIKKPIVNLIEESFKMKGVFDSNWRQEFGQEYKKKVKSLQKNVEKELQKRKKSQEFRENLASCIAEKTVLRQMTLLNLSFSEKIPDHEDEKEVLPLLTPFMEEIIDNALRRNPSGEILATKYNLQITRRDINTLSGLNWLNDEVDVFSYDLLLIPVHLGMHWCLASIDFRKKEINFYDSMHSVNNKCLEALRGYLSSEYLDKKSSSYYTDNWSLNNVKNIPQQMNGSDCGIFACKFAEYLSRDAKLTFTQAHMPYFRRRMVYEIVSQRLI